MESNDYSSRLNLGLGGTLNALPTHHDGIIGER